MPIFWRIFFFAGYVAVRGGECAKLAIVCWAVTGQALIAAALALVFSGAVYFVVDHTYRKAPHSAAFWHGVVEFLLTPLSFTLAWNVAVAQVGHPSPIAALSFGFQWALYTMLLLALQFILSVFGHEIVVRAAGR